MMITIPTFPFGSSPSIAHVSSSIAIHDSSPPSSLPPTEELLGEVGLNVKGGKLFSWCEYLSAREFPYNPSDVTNKLKELDPPFQVLLAEASMVILGLSEDISGAEATKRKLEDNF
ncbi:hypothetical protein J1N35_010947 [Gossypium stocksii]|uniref:Uncharacterized protein n=1 Tax=Gossypium stocksii TaxID=47602 RepID=A0A9D3W1J5_9ROSI|nr:hypothetical protein J1N35_010947 [Gossypium stocksii]